MKTSNLILKVMENLQTNIAILATVKRNLIFKLGDEEYDRLSDAMSDKDLERPCLAIDNYMHELEEEYNYLEQLLLTIDKPFQGFFHATHMRAHRDTHIHTRTHINCARARIDRLIYIYLYKARTKVVHIEVSNIQYSYCLKSVVTTREKKQFCQKTPRIKQKNKRCWTTSNTIKNQERGV